MVQIKPFAVEQWFDRYETTPGVLNIAETCAASLSLDELAALSADGAGSNPVSSSLRLVYGPIRGSPALRESIASMCGRLPDGTPSQLSPEDVIITQGAIGANFLVFYTLIGPGDHVICVYPTYQQLYDVPASLGAEVSLWKLTPEKGWLPDPAELEGLVKPNTKMIVINNPNNPSGSIISPALLQQIIAFAQARNIIVLCDEVYRPLFHNLFDDPKSVPPSAVALGYSKTIITGSMSKAYALAGIRIGWIASTDKDIMRSLAEARDYTTISVSQVDDQIATFALSEKVLPSLLRRNVELAKINVALLAEFVEKHADVCSWVKPSAGTTAFIQFRNKGKPVHDPEFCIGVLNDKNIFIVPGSVCFGGDEDFGGYVRVGYVCHTEVLREALGKLDEHISRNLSA